MVHSLLACRIVFLVVVSNAAVTGPNALATAYHEVFTNPEGIDLFVIGLDGSFYRKFEACSKMSEPVLNQLEKQLRGQYGACDDNWRCTQLAKDIQTVLNLRTKVRALGAYLKATESDSAPSFEQSEIGKIAGQIFSAFKSLGVPDDQLPAFIEKNPEFQREMGILSAIPCR